MKKYFSSVFKTFADRQGAAPLSVESTLSSGISIQDVTSVTGEVDNIVEVELATIGSSIGWVARVTTSDSWWRREDRKETLKMRKTQYVNHCVISYTLFCFVSEF